MDGVDKTRTHLKIRASNQVVKGHPMRSGVQGHHQQLQCRVRKRRRRRHINASTRLRHQSTTGAVGQYLPQHGPLNATGLLQARRWTEAVFLQNQIRRAGGGPIKKERAFLFID